MKATAIFGPPGTGKTRTLVGIAERLAAKGPVLFLSYTRAAATEATSRLVDRGDVRASTIHSLAFNALGMNRAAVVDAKKLADFGKQTGIPFKGSEEGSDEQQEGDEYLAVLQYANNRQIPVKEAYEHFGCPGTRDRFIMFGTSYTNWKRTFGYMDFDDMLYKLIDSGRVNNGYRGVMLDEAQDCSPLQWAAFKTAIRHSDDVFIAGDDDQAVYEWNGADPHGMIEFVKQTGARIEVLNQSYRVPRVVHEAATGLARTMSRRVKKEFKPRDGEGVITRYGDFWNIDLDLLDANSHGQQSMILVRDRFRMDEVKRALNREMIPYDVLGGHSPWTSKIAKELRRGESPAIPPHWQEFYAQADLQRPINLIVSTIHQAKGHEAERVVLDLALPSRVLLNLAHDRDAEVRVMYVALTRAREELLLCGNNPLI